MRKFTFRLDSLFNYRTRIEEISKKEFSEALNLLLDEEARLKSIEEDYARASAEMDRLKEGEDSPERLSEHAGYLTWIKAAMIAQEKRISACAAELERKREALAEATRDKKVIEKVKDRALDRYSSDLAKEEQKATDETASTRFKKAGHEK